MLHPENAVPVLPFTSLSEALTGRFPPTHVPAIIYRRFHVRSPCCTSASFNRSHRSRSTRHLLPVFPITHQLQRTALYKSSVAVPVSSTVTLDKKRVRYPPSYSPCPSRLSRAPTGFRFLGARCCVSFSLACRPDQP